LRTVSRAFGIGIATISERFPNVSVTKGVAVELATVETKIAALPPAQQATIRTAADVLRRTMHTLSMAADIAADNSRRLHSIAAKSLAYAEAAGDAGGDILPHLETVGMAVRVAEISATPALRVLAIGRDQVGEKNRTLSDLIAAAAVSADADSARSGRGGWGADGRRCRPSQPGPDAASGNPDRSGGGGD